MRYIGAFQDEKEKYTCVSCCANDMTVFKTGLLLSSDIHQYDKFKFLKKICIFQLR